MRECKGHMIQQSLKIIQEIPRISLNESEPTTESTVDKRKHHTNEVLEV